MLQRRLIDMTMISRENG